MQLHIHGSWIVPLSQKVTSNYEYITNFCSANDLRISEVSRFLRGFSVSEESFEDICKALKYDSKEVQMPIR